MESPSLSITPEEQLKSLRDTVISTLAGVAAFYIVNELGLPPEQQVTITGALVGIAMYVLRFLRGK